MAWNNYGKTGQSSSFDAEEAYEVNPTVLANRIVQGVIDAPIKALESGKPFDEGLYSYTLGVENLELLCRANKWIGGEGDDYDSTLQTKLEAIRKDLDSEKVVARRDAKISKVKFEILLTRILETRMKEGPLKV